MIELSDVRYLCIYPALIVGGIAWAILFALRYRTCAAVEAAWGAAIAISLAIMGGLGMFALWLRVDVEAPAAIHNAVFTMALATPAVVVSAGAVRLFWLQWRNGGGR